MWQQIITYGSIEADEGSTGSTEDRQLFLWFCYTLNIDVTITIIFLVITNAAKTTLYVMLLYYLTMALSAFPLSFLFFLLSF